MQMTEAPRRLFFALWPSDDLRRHIASATESVMRESGGRAIPTQNLHATLAFVGNVSPSDLNSVMNAGAATIAPSFTLMLDRVEPWRRSGVLVLDSSAGTPVALELLVERLRISLLEQQVKLPTEIYRLHVTLVRRLPRQYRTITTISPIEWSPQEFALVDSVTTRNGSEYKVLSRWPLA